MKRVKQTITTVPGGNCFAACIASILELPIESVPNFCNMEGDWWNIFQGWLGDRDLFAFEIRLPSVPAVSRIPEGVWCVLSGKSPRNAGLHSVVGRGAWDRGFEMVFDPHPDNTFLDGEPTEVLVIGALNPHA